MASMSWLRWLGKYSYGIYVYHYIYHEFYYAARHYVGDVTGSKSLGGAAYFLSIVLTGISAAWISYNVYERRWLRLKGKIAQYTIQRNPGT